MNVFVELSSGTQLSCDLLVGADGIHSKVRGLIFGEEEKFVHEMGYQTAAYTFNRTSGYAEIRDTFDTITEPGRQISIYPIRGDRLAAFFLFTKDTPTHTSHGEAINQLKEHFGDMGWVIPNILREGESVADLYFDNVAQVEMSQWAKGRVALVGDACGCVSLVAGQGSSLAMAEAYTLARCLAEHKSDMRLALEDYEILMVPQVTKIQRSARQFASYFFPDTKWKLVIRDITMRASVVPVIRKFIKFKSVRLPK